VSSTAAHHQLTHHQLTHHHQQQQLTTSSDLPPAATYRQLTTSSQVQSSFVLYPTVSSDPADFASDQSHTTYLARTYLSLTLEPYLSLIPQDDTLPYIIYISVLKQVHELVLNLVHDS